MQESHTRANSMYNLIFEICILTCSPQSDNLISESGVSCLPQGFCRLEMIGFMFSLFSNDRANWRASCKVWKWPIRTRCKVPLAAAAARDLVGFVSFFL